MKTLEELKRAFNLTQDVMDDLPVGSPAYLAAQKTLFEIEDLIWDTEEKMREEGSVWTA